MAMRWSLRTMLAATTVLIGCGGREADPEAGAWEFKVDTVQSAGGAHQTSFLRVVGQEGPPEEARTRSVILSFDCRPENAGSAIMTDQALRQGSTEATLTVDAGPPRKVPGFAGTTPATGTTQASGQVVLTTPPESLLAALSGHQRAVIEYTDGAGSSHTVAEFPIAGVETYRDRFLAACAKRRG
jgi:hypothetical protein